MTVWRVSAGAIHGSCPAACQDAGPAINPPFEDITRGDDV